MAESKVLQIANNVRPNSLQKNIYKVDSPYDLTDDVVTRSLNLLQNITGYDYRSNSVIDIVERLIDAENSELVKIGGERLLVEFSRRAANNVLDKFIPSPTNFINDLKNIIKGDFKKADASITDLNKDPSRTFFDKVLQTGIGYRNNENFLDKEYGKHDNTKTSDVNFNYSGDMIKEKIQQLNKKSVFSTYNTQSSKVEFQTQSLVFRNTYNEEFTTSLETTNNLTETFTKSYFQIYEKQQNSLTKDYLLETEDLEFTQGFGFLNNTIARELNTDPIRLQKVSLDIDENAEENRRKEVGEGNADTYRYDSNTSGQNLLNTQFGVRRGLVYFTSKLAQNEKSTIPQNVKQLYKYNEGNDETIFWKGNGACRTFTIYDQYDNYNRVIRFDGNGENKSVLRDSVLPRIAPTVGALPEDKYNYFFTMENLALKDSVDECEIGPNGGRWMWFPPYDVKISDNNSVNWSDMNFLGRPEPIFSYQNTTRSLSLSFRLLIDTVKKVQDIEPTIQNYYKYLYQCGEPAFKEKIEKREVVITSETPTTNSEIVPNNVFTNVAKYYFKNEAWAVDLINPDYTSGDTNPSFSSFTNNSGFLGELSQVVNSLKELLLDKNVTEISMSFQGAASSLISLTATTEFAKSYNRALGMRRADNLMRNVIYEYNQIRGDAPELILSEFISKAGPTIPDSIIDGFGQVVNPTPPDTGQVGVNAKRTYYQSIDGKIISITIATFGADSNPNPVDKTDPNKIKINDKGKVSQRYAILDSMDYKVNIVIEDRKINTDKQIVDVPIPADESAQKPEPCDENKNLQFKSIKKENKFPTGFEKLEVFSPVFNSQTPFDFTKRYIFLHQLTRPSKLNNLTSIDNTVFGRMPVFVIRYGDFIYSKAIARSINFDITDSTWDLNPEGMGVIPLYCNVTMDLTLIGGQSLAGPIDRIQTANDSNFIANSTFNSGFYANNKTFEKARKQEEVQWPKIANVTKPNPSTKPANGNRPQDASFDNIPKVENRPNQYPEINPDELIFS